MIENKNFAQRLKLIRSTLGFKQKDFAQKLQVSGPTLSEIEKGKYKPGHDFFYNIATEFKVNLYYLIFGEGDMFLDPTNALLNSSDEFVVNRKEVNDFLWFFKKSKIIQYLILGHFRTIMLQEKDAIEKEINEESN